MDKQYLEQKHATGTCESGCICRSIVALSRKPWKVSRKAAVAVLMMTLAHAALSQAEERQGKPSGDALAITVVTGTNAVRQATGGEAVWGKPMTSMTELSVVATNTDAVFVVIPTRDGSRTSEIKTEVSSVAASVAATGVKIGTFLLSKDAPQYEDLVRQVGSPAVLVLRKGRGMAAAKEKEITKDGLLKVFAAAWHPAGGCPSGCSHETSESK